MDAITHVASSKFPLGRIVITSNAASRLNAVAVQSGLAPPRQRRLRRPRAQDIQSNEDALIHTGRLFSAYGKGDGRFWIITECDRSVTTILLPEDY